MTSERQIQLPRGLRTRVNRLVKAGMFVSMEDAVVTAVTALILQCQLKHALASGCLDKKTKSALERLSKPLSEAELERKLRKVGQLVKSHR